MNIQFTAGKFMALDNNGIPAVGFQVWAYLSPDTTTPATTYSDFECTVPNTWPVVLDARGEAFIYVNIGTDFYLTTDTATDISAPIWTSRKVGLQQGIPPLLATTTPGTTHNNYAAIVTPLATSIADEQMIVFTPDVDSKTTLTSYNFTGTGINDLIWGGGYSGTTPGSIFSVEIESVAAVLDSHIKLLLHADDTGATFVDSETTPKTVTANGDVTQSDVQYKFGGKSALFDGTGDYLSLADDADWYLGTTAFTIDFWVRFTSVTDATFVAQHEDANNTMYFDYDATTHKIRFYYKDSSTARADYDFLWTPVVDTWYYIQLVRKTSTLYLFIDGDKKTWTTATTAISTNSLGDLTGDLTIGYGASVGSYFAGYMDEFCWSKGIARHTASFAVPTQAYAVGGADTIKWKKDGGAYTTGVAITATTQTLIEGIKFTFSTKTGHTVGDVWALTVETPATLNFCSLGAEIIYRNLGGSLTVLDAGDLKQDIPAIVIYSSTQGYILQAPGLPVLSELQPEFIIQEINGDYVVTINDARKFLNCAGTGTITLPTCAVFSLKDVWIKSKDASVITINVAGGADLIYFPFDTTGATSINVGAGSWDLIRLASNGAYWTVVEVVSPLSGTAGFTTPGAATWICPEGIRTVYITGCAAGAGGTSVGGVGDAYGNGGGYGQFTEEQAITVEPLTTYNITIPDQALTDVAGADLVFDTLLTLTGGLVDAGTNGAGQGGRFGDGGAAGRITGVATSADGSDATGYGAGGGGGSALGGSSADGGKGSQGFLKLRW